GGRACRIEQALLRDEDEWLRTRETLPDRALVVRDLFGGSADVYGQRARALLGAPRDRTVQRPIDLEHTGAVAEALQLAHVARRQGITRDRGELARRDIEDDGAQRREIAHRRHTPSGLDRAAEADEVVGHGAGDRLRAAAHARPADRMGRYRHGDAGRGGAGPARRDD